MNNPFKNKHILAAVIVTPILALISFFATDHFVSEKPHAAKEGSSYQLIGRPNCRYTSGICTLKNGDFMLDIAFTDTQVTVDSKLPLEGVKIGINDSAPIELIAINKNEKNWLARISNRPSSKDQLKLVAKAQNAIYYAEQPLGFIEKKTLTD